MSGSLWFTGCDCVIEGAVSLSSPPFPFELGEVTGPCLLAEVLRVLSSSGSWVLRKPAIPDLPPSARLPPRPPAVAITVDHHVAASSSAAATAPTGVHTPMTVTIEPRTERNASSAAWEAAFEGVNTVTTSAAWPKCTVLWTPYESDQPSRPLSIWKLNFSH